MAASAFVSWRPTSATCTPWSISSSRGGPAAPCSYAGARPSIDGPSLYIHSNVLGITRLLELARTDDNDCFVWASSSSVYGGTANEEFTEDDTVDNPVSPYAATKKAYELMSSTYQSLSVRAERIGPVRLHGLRAPRAAGHGAVQICGSRIARAGDPAVWGKDIVAGLHVHL